MNEKKVEKRRALSDNERMKNILYTNVNGLSKNTGKRGGNIDVAFLFGCIDAIVEREGRTKRFVLLSLLDSGLRSSEAFRDTFEAFSKEWSVSHSK